MKCPISILIDGVQILVGEFELDPMPGCKKVCISHHLTIFPEYRGKGYGKKAQADRLALAKSLGYHVIIATVIETNKPQNKILSDAKWKRVTFFDNPDTGNRVTLWCKNLTDPYEEVGGCR